MNKEEISKDKAMREGTKAIDIIYKEEKATTNRLTTKNSKISLLIRILMIKLGEWSLKTFEEIPIIVILNKEISESKTTFNHRTQDDIM
jgi:hypothetical protein